MKRNPLHTTAIPGKVAVWQLVDRAIRILRVQLTSEAFAAYRLPSLTPLPDAQPGTIMFDADPDLVDARALLSEHSNLWNAVREDYWAALLNRADVSSPSVGGQQINESLSTPTDIAPSVRALLAAFHEDTRQKLDLAPVDGGPIFQGADGSMLRVDEDGWICDSDADLDKADAPTIKPIS